ncbi:hypothetical protein [Natronorubrum thiooxidans]|uniref:CHAT domain-containing protein n=1 Tax=Natronorubrum thiooxidans TaxID=308853 RepID=A0A1N7G9Y6_9EURY|nr:hypothetical protein [Natronorubrum thiooxidans]SIS09316.1 hypothetical protein SAMN05421752_110153 [Natronorubrum thiooxidans]
MKPTFEPTQNGLEIVDPIERHRYHLTTYGPVSLEPAETDRIPYPVDAAVDLSAEMLTLPTSNTIYVREHDGSMVEEVRPSEQASFPREQYVLDLSGPLKVYARLESSVQIYSDADRTYVSLDGSTAVQLGARSYHRRPAGTITTTADPTDMMQAISAFGSALKTTTPERSYPTLRGHPPQLELGDALTIPSRFNAPATGIRIEIPQTLRHVFVVAPLAYYLGADVVPGSTPRLVTETGFTYPLGEKPCFEDTVERVLKHIFFLDCIVRTEGTTPLPLHEREAIEPALEFDLGRVYELSLPDQLETYLRDVPFQTVNQHFPDWSLETRVQPDPNGVEFLPFVANSLSSIRIQDTETQSAVSTREQTQAIEEFVRGDFVRNASSVRGMETTSNPNERASIPTIEQCWESSESAQITSKTPLSAFHNNIGRQPRADPIEIEVVCNDSEMWDELEAIDGVYGTREELPFDVSVHYELSTDELEDVLASETDFLHFIGHIDDDGLQCSDGTVDASLLETSGAKAFLLNGCQSHDQGLHLIEAGSIGGIVTLDDVVNSGAVRVGGTVARLLNRGYPLYAAVELARKKSVVGQQYHIVGDGMITIAQSKMGSPNVCSVTTDEDHIWVNMYAYTSVNAGKGGVYTPGIDSIETYYVIPGKTERIPVTKSQLRELFSLDKVSVLINGEIRWSDDIDVEKLA